MANRVQRQRVTIHTDAFLIELNDPSDSLQAEGTPSAGARWVQLSLAKPNDALSWTKP